MIKIFVTIALTGSTFGLAAMPANLAAMTVCTPGPYVITFDQGTSKLSDVQLEILDNAFENFRRCESISIMEITAFSAGEGRALQERRAFVVMRQMQMRGS